MPIDTDITADRKQVELLRNAGFTKRLQLTLSLCNMAINLARKAIADAHPQATRRQIDIMFVEYHYGKVLADKLKQYFEQDEWPRSM